MWPPMLVAAAPMYWATTMSLATTTRMLAPFLDRMTDEELDALPYGVVELDAQGRIRSYNKAERENVGCDRLPVGEQYFLEVYPSSYAPEFYGRFLEAIESQSLDDTFLFTYTCSLPSRRVQVRMYYCVRTASTWIFTAQPDGTPLARVIDVPLAVNR